MSRLEIVTRLVDELTDGLGLEIDSKIKKAVIAFNYAGFHTSQSCEGHLEKWGTPYPWIQIDGTISIPTMQKFLDKFYSNRDKNENHLRIVANSINYRIQSDYIRAYADLVPLYDRDPERLKNTQKEMDDFSEFLIKEIVE